MDDGLSPTQLATLCVVFVGFHLLALPAFFWAMRHRQFSGAEQRVWTLADSEPLPEVISEYRPDPRRLRWMLGILMTFGILMISAVVLTLVMALIGPAHPVTAGAKCPF